MMKLVLDSNIIFSALIKKSITRDIILSDLFELYAPEYIFKEITKHKELLLKKSKLDGGDFEALLLLLQKHIHLVTKEKYYEKMAVAEDILGNIDRYN
jgi:predicted nucleic acid-binding protein